VTFAKGKLIKVTNVGSAPHTFTIWGRGIDIVNDPRQTQSVAIDRAPGTYAFVCLSMSHLG
jgi:hypothetical protein